MCSPYFLLATDCSLWLFVVAFAFTVDAAVTAQITLGNVARVYPETVQGLMFYCAKYIYD